MRAWLYHIQPWHLAWIAVVLFLGAALPVAHALRQQDPASALSDSPYLRIDPDKIVLSDRDSRIPCGECHTLEYDVWQETPHATGFDELHRSEQAQGILDRMDFRLSKRESLCLRCHYTAVEKNDQARAIAGVSCESCHGAARDWLNVHNDYAGATHETETEAHRQQRIAESERLGMLRPSDNLYAVAANCFECHTVPNEKLINVGGHPSGSRFDLLEWSDKIRHNFLAAQWSDDETNRARTPERKRLMFVLGRVLNYEYSLRAAAEATETGTFAKAMERRVKVARRDLDKVYRVAPLPAVQAILTRGREVRIGPGNRDALLAAAAAISTLAQQFADEHDGTALAALDPLLAGEPVAAADDAATEDEAEDEADEETVAADDTTGDATGDAPGDTTATAEAATGTAAGAATPAEATVKIIPAVGEKRRRPAWFAASRHETLGPSAGCSCHNDQFAWWDRDAHSLSASPLLNHDPRAVQIAETYGLSPAQMKRGNQICMSCHGTIVTGEEAEEVFDGVSCENCHGPGGAYERKHQPPEPAPANWSGYAKAASLGMVNLEQVSARAANCARCHHITDERLISSGHSTGEGFDLGRRDQQIRHWEAPLPGAGDLNAAYRQAIQGRAIPKNVRLATVVGGASATTAAAAGPSSTTTRRTAPRRAGPRRQGRVQPPRVRPGGGSAPPVRSVPLDLPPLPAVSDTTSTEDVLLIIKQRLELLYTVLGRGQGDGR